MILNSAFGAGKLPDLWHVHTFIPVSTCDNYRGIALMSLSTKLFSKILLSQQILALRMAADGIMSQLYRLSIIFTFIDFCKTFDSIKWT